MALLTQNPDEDLQRTTLTNQLVKPPAPLPIGGGIVPQAGLPQPIEMSGQPPVNSVTSPPPSLVPDPIVAPTPVSSMPSAGPQYGPSSNLIGTQVNPGPVTATAPNTDFGTGAVQAGAPINPDDSLRFSTLSGQQDAAVGDLTAGPNRTALAQQALRDFDIEGLPQLEEGYRRVGQRAATLGRLGAGMTTNDLTGLSATYQRNRGLAARGLARDVAEGDINDRFRRVGMLSGLRGQEEDIRFGRRGELRGEREYGTGLNERNAARLYDRQRSANDYLGDYQDRLFGQNRVNANDLRGERDFQTGRSDQAAQAAIQQRILEEQLLNQAFGRSQDQLAAGRTGNPADYLMSAGGVEQDQANNLFGGAGDLLKSGSPILTEEMIRRIMANGGAS